MHIILYRGTCSNCGKVCKGEAPRKFQAGYGPNLSALVQGLITLGLSRRGVLEFLRDKGFVRTSHGEGLQISHGGLNRILERVSSALKAHYEKIGEIARTVPINHVDETGWRMFGPAGKIKVWLWVMVSCLVTFFMIHTRRSKEGFQELVGNWSGILTSDDYAVYSSWPAELRQSCPGPSLQGSQKAFPGSCCRKSQRRPASVQGAVPPHQNRQRDAHRGPMAGVNDESEGTHQLVQKTGRLPRYSCQAS